MTTSTPAVEAIAVSAHPGASRHIANEFDLVAEYEVNKVKAGF